MSHYNKPLFMLPAKMLGAADSGQQCLHHAQGEAVRPSQPLLHAEGPRVLQWGYNCCQPLECFWRVAAVRELPAACCSPGLGCWFFPDGGLWMWCPILICAPGEWAEVPHVHELPAQRPCPTAPSSLALPNCAMLHFVTPERSLLIESRWLPGTF